LLFRLLGFDYADQFRRHQTTSEGWLVHEKQNVQRITIIAQGGRNVTEVKRKHTANWQHPR